MLPGSASRRDDRGETLIELLAALVILSIAAVAILTGVMTSIRASAVHKNEASGGAYVRSFAEAIQNHIDTSGYAACGSAATTYQGVSVPDLPAGYTRAVTDVQSWTGSVWGACTGSGIQRVKLTVTTNGTAEHRATESLTVILRRPCNGLATATGSDPCA